MNPNHNEENLMNVRARDLPESMVPHHQHDCDACIYLGSDTQHCSQNHPTWCPKSESWDFYFCDAGNGGSIIARHGVDGDYYSSSLALFTARPRDANDPLEWAYCHYIVASW